MNALRTARKSSWARLYAMLLVVIVVYLIALGAMPATEEHRWLDLLLLVLIYGVMWVWVHFNRAAIGQRDQQRRPRRTNVTQVIPFPSAEASCYSLAGRTLRALQAEHLVHLVNKN